MNSKTGSVYTRRGQQSVVGNCPVRVSISMKQFNQNCDPKTGNAATRFPDVVTGGACWTA